MKKKQRSCRMGRTEVRRGCRLDSDSGSEVALALEGRLPPGKRQFQPIHHHRATVTDLHLLLLSPHHPGSSPEASPRALPQAIACTLGVFPIGDQTIPTGSATHGRLKKQKKT